MSKTADEIARKLKEINHRDNDTMIGIVKSVDADNAVCDVDVDGLLFSEVQLKSIMKSGTKGTKLLPKKDSVVIVERIGKSNELFVAMYSELDSITWEIENMKYFVDKDGFVFNNGNNKGMVKLPELVQKLNNLENKVNQIITWTSTHTHTGVTVGMGSTSFAVGVSGSLTPTQESDLENQKVKH